MPVVSVFAITGLTVPQAPLGLALRVKRTGSVWVFAVVHGVVPAGVQLTVAVSVRVLEPSAGVQTVAPTPGTQPVLLALLVLVATVAMVVGGPASVWVMVKVPLPLVAASVALMVQNPAAVPEM